MAMTLTLAGGTADAQHWHRHHLHYSYPHRVMTVVSRPAVTVRISNHLTQKERFCMAMAYLDTHPYLTVKQYVRMTEMTKVAAEAELDAFAADASRPVKVVMRGKKKVYVTDGKAE